MRRWLSIPMMMLLLFPLVSGFFGVDADASLPACCRRSGRHQCGMMSDSSNQAGLSAVREKCPSLPAALSVRVLPSFAPATAAAIYAGVMQHTSVSAQTEARRRISYDRARQKRGPPALLA